MRPGLPGFPLLLLGPSRAISSAGSAPPRQGGGHWFEPSIAHLESPAPAGFRRSPGRRRVPNTCPVEEGVGPGLSHRGGGFRRAPRIMPSPAPPQKLERGGSDLDKEASR